MRNFTISNLFASVVTRVINVVAAGIAARSFLRLTMREHMGNRFEQCQADSISLLLLGSLLPGSKRLNLRPTYALAYDMSAQTVCPAPRLSQARASWRG